MPWVELLEACVRLNAHLLSAADIDREAVDALFDEASGMETAVQESGGTIDLRGKVLATLFYEPSTRTRLSFEAAMCRLAGSVISTENARENSSGSKGETLEDTARIVGSYADGIVIRHYEEGAAGRLASASAVPVINAGDGPGEHPTQALLDLFTMQQELGRIDGLKIAFVGDLANGRTVHSLCRLLTLYSDITISFIAPQSTPIRQEIRGLLGEHNVMFHESDDLASVVGSIDVLYQTRVQKERFETIAAYEQARGFYVVDPGLMTQLSPNAIVMHPLPRVDEIHQAVDADPRAAYFRQARNGLFVRMALLKMMLLKENGVG